MIFEEGGSPDGWTGAPSMGLATGQMAGVSPDENEDSQMRCVMVWQQP